MSQGRGAGSWPFAGTIPIEFATPRVAVPSTKAHLLRDGEPCGHRGCLSHVSHPCEGCGRIAGALLPAPIIDGEPQEIECTDMLDLDVCIPGEDD